MTYDWGLFTGDNKIKRDKKNFILSYIHVSGYTDKSNKDGWVMVNQSTLINILNKSGIEILKELQRDGYIECDGVYKKGYKSFGFRLNYNKCQKRGIRVYDNKYYKKAQDLINGKIIKLDPQTKYILEKTKEFFNTGVISFGKNEKRVDSLVRSFRSSGRHGYHKYWSQKTLVDRIKIGDITAVADKQGARIYTNYSNLSKDVRKYLEIDGKEKICIDISNSQFQTLCLTITEKFGIKSKFIDLTHSGKLYEYFVNRIGHKDYNRDRIKVDMLNWLYAENHVAKNKKRINYIEEIMKFDFPEIYNAIIQMKSGSKGGSRLAMNMQYKESSVIKEIQYDLLCRGINVITLHDSFYVAEDTPIEIISEIEDRLIFAGYTSIKIEKDNLRKQLEDQKIRRWQKKIEVKEERERVNYYLDRKVEKDTHMMDSFNNKKAEEIQNIKLEEKLIDKYLNMDDYLLKMREILVNS